MTVLLAKVGHDFGSRIFVLKFKMLECRPVKWSLVRYEIGTLCSLFAGIDP